MKLLHGIKTVEEFEELKKAVRLSIKKWGWIMVNTGPRFFEGPTVCGLCALYTKYDERGIPEICNKCVLYTYWGIKCTFSGSKYMGWPYETHPKEIRDDLIDIYRIIKKEWADRQLPHTHVPESPVMPVVEVFEYNPTALYSGMVILQTTSNNLRNWEKVMDKEAYLPNPEYAVRVFLKEIFINDYIGDI